MSELVRLDDHRLGTPNLVPGKRVYDEMLLNVGGREVRTWDPTRSKLAAYVLKGGREWGFTPSSRVLYLGAANGTTPSHVSDLCPDGVVVGVEFSPRSFRDLVGVAGDRPNLLPVLADAWQPERYARLAGSPDILYMDIAQRRQAAVLARNVEAFQPKLVYFMVKARSIDVARDPREVITEAASELADATGYRILDVVDLAPFEKDHACVVLAPGGERRDRPFVPPPPRERPPREDRRFQRGGFSRGPPREGFQRGPPREGFGRGPPREGFQRGPPRSDRRDDRRDDRRGPPRGGAPGFGPKGPGFGPKGPGFGPKGQGPPGKGGKGFKKDFRKGKR